MGEVKHDRETLKELQSLSLSDKVAVTQDRIIEFYEHYDGNVVVAFSGGKDSTVLLHIVRGLFPDVKAVFSNTGLEYPEIQKFVRAYDNVDIVRPKLTFKEVLIKYGYPLISKEVAEAIHYARQNVRGGKLRRTLLLGGVNRTTTKQYELLGIRPMGDIPSEEEPVGTPDTDTTGQAEGGVSSERRACGDGTCSESGMRKYLLGISTYGGVHQQGNAQNSSGGVQETDRPSIRINTFR